MELEFYDSENNLLNEITQWDINRKLKIKGLTLIQAPMIHFYNQYCSRALVVQSAVSENEILVNIPNILLQKDVPITVAIFVEETENEAKTVYMNNINVKTKMKPEDYTFEENIEYINWKELDDLAKNKYQEMQNLIDDINSKLANGEFNGRGIDRIEKTGTEGLVDTYTIYYTDNTTSTYNVKNGEKGDTGYTPQKGTDYWTEQDKTEIVNYTKDIVIPLIEDEFGNKLDLSINSSTYVMTLKLLNKSNEVLSEGSIDLPIETMVVNARYENATKELIIILQNGTEIEVPIGDLINGLVSESTFNTAINELKDRITPIETDVSNIKEEQIIQNENIDKIKDNLINLSVEGEEINVNDSSDLGSRITPKANTKQETTEGYNLWQLPQTETKDGLTFTNNGDGTFNIHGKGSKYNTFEINLSPENSGLEDGEEYKLIANNVPDLIIVVQQWGTIDSNFLGNIVNKGETKKYIKNNEANYIKMLIGINKNIDINYNNVEVTLFKGTGVKPFEPYTGGIPAPNPDYPQEMTSVTGNIEIKQNGKNLFDGIIENGGINAENGELVVNDNRRRSKNFIKVKPNTNYTIQRTSGDYRWIVGYTKNKVGIIDGNYNNMSSGIKSLNIGENNTTFKTTSTTEYIKWYDTNKNASNGKTQIELNTQLTEYEPYKGKLYPLSLGDIELNKIGDSQDYFSLENGKWYLNKEIENYVLNGTENISAGIYGTNSWIIRLTNLPQTEPKTEILVISDKFKGIKYNDRVENAPNTIYVDTDIQNIYIRNTEILNLTEYLTQNNTILKYVLKIPTKTEITDETLINQLNALYNAETFKPTTNLSSNSIAILKLDYIADTKAYIDNKLNNINTNANANTIQTLPLIKNNVENIENSEI